MEDSFLRYFGADAAQSAAASNAQSVKSAKSVD
jgi:hypothetical protein